MMRTIGNHIHAAILRAVTGIIEADEANRKKTCLIVEDIRSIEWASATFVGARHEIDLRIEGPAEAVGDALDRLVAELPEREIPVRGHIVAEISASLAAGAGGKAQPDAAFLTVNALTIID